MHMMNLQVNVNYKPTIVKIGIEPETQFRKYVLTTSYATRKQAKITFSFDPNTGSAVKRLNYSCCTDCQEMNSIIKKTGVHISPQNIQHTHHVIYEHIILLPYCSVRQS